MKVFFPAFMMATGMSTTSEMYQEPGMPHMLVYVAPATILIYYILASTISTCTLQGLKSRAHSAPYRTLQWLTVLVLISFVAEALMLLIDSIYNQARYSSTDSNVYALSNVLVWMILVGCFAAKTSVWYPHCGSWVIALIAEAINFTLYLRHGFAPAGFVHAQMTVQASRVLILALLPAVLLTQHSLQKGTDPECSPLLSHGQTSSTTAPVLKGNSAYGSFSASSTTRDDKDDHDDHDKDDDADDDDDDYTRKRKEKEKKVEEQLLAKGNWYNYARSFSMFIPLLWPTRKRILKLYLFGVLVCLGCGRALNVLEPRQFGIVLDRLSTIKGDGHFNSVILETLLFVLYRWIDAVIVGPIRRLLWTPIEQNAQKSIETAAYNHIMDLSRDFHTEKQSGELYTSINQGSSIIGILKTMVFEVLPVFIDLVVAAAYLYYVFGPYMALILAATSIFYLWSSTWFLSKQTKIRRTLTKLVRKQAQLMYDTVGGWDAVSHFNTANYEKGRFSDAVGWSFLHAARLTAHMKEIHIFYVAWMGQDSIMEFGLFCATFLAIYQISSSEVPIGSFAMLISYWGNFSSHLYQLISTRRQFLVQLIEAEALRELFQRKPTVKDGSVALDFEHGVVEFQEVGFSYDGEKEIINEISLRVESGQRVALVGETGGGKSTFLKLLFRFYDPRRGRITIDGQDIKEVTLQSLRHCIGVVPQDPSLFNDTIMENVRYSKLDATDGEVMDACKAAAIHDKIIRFPKGYASKVGEKGVKLSGGELQRIAIARVILKDPKIILLDEATSAVDTETEGRIQAALRKLTHGRTSFTVAHRLSTIADADIILVIKDGSILEQGHPDQLLKAKGKYFDLWTKQVGITAIPTADSRPSDTSDTPKERDNQDKMLSSQSSSSAASRSLRATAPHFVPRDNPVADTRHEKDLEEGQQSYDDAALGYRQGTRTASDPQTFQWSTKSGAKLGGGKRSQYAVVSFDQEDEGIGQTESKRKIRNTFFQRRRNKNREPSDPAYKQVEVDGPCARSTTTRLQSRCASASSDPLSSMTRTREETHGRRRRQRRWRIRDNDSTSAQPGTSTHEAYPTPNVPMAGPSHDCKSHNEVGVSEAGRGGVHFASGV